MIDTMIDQPIDPEVRPGAFWERLGGTDRQALRAMGRRTTVPPGGTLCHQGVAAAGVHILFRAGPRTTGDVVAKEFVDSSEGDESIIDLFGPGDLVGALAPWGHPQRGTVVALDHIEALRLDRRSFGSLLAANPQITEAMMHAMARHAAFGGRRHAVRAAEHQQRLAYHLLELAHRFGTPAGRGARIRLRMSQAELANWAGISRETLVRWFRVWRTKGIIDHRARPLTILDLDALRRAASPWGDEWEEHAAPSPPVVGDGGRPAGLAAGPPVRAEPSGALDGGRHEAAPSALPLPAARPAFAGRIVSLGKLDLLVSQNEMPRAVIIQGMAGVGKTTLALHWAQRAAAGFPGGVVFADLRGTTGRPATPAEAMGQVLRAAGVAGDQLPRTAPELEAHCRSVLAGRRMLLILDNADEVEQVRPLVAAADAALVVVTTQRRLPSPLEGADVRTLELQEMGPQEAVDLIAAVLGPGDTRVRDEGRAAARLARACGHLPLALAVTAARLAEDPDASIAETVRELEDTGLLRDGDLGRGGGQGLHTLLGPTFDISYRGLPREQRDAFRRLALVPGPDVTPHTLAAALACPVEEAAGHLEALRQAHLIQDAGPGRYRIHDLLRDFARERSLGEESDNARMAAQQRLLAAFLTGARQAERSLGLPRRPALRRVPDGEHAAADPPAPAERAVALAWFEDERRNLVAAVHLAARLGLHRTCWELADALSGFQAFRRYTQDNVEVQQAGLRAARAEEDWHASAVMLHHLAVAHFELGGSVQAIGYGEEARRGFRSVDPPDPFGEAFTLATLADLHASLGRYPTAIVHAGRSLEIHRALGEDGGVAQAHETLASAFIGLADYDTALGHADAALRLRRRIDDPPGIAKALLILSRWHRRRGAIHEAVAFALEALYIRQDLADRHGTAQALTELARMNASLGLRELALRDVEQALGIYQALGARRGEARALSTLGRLMCDGTRFAEAFTYCGQALQLHRDIGDRSGEAETLAQIGIVHWRLGRYREAREQLVRALELRREIGDPHGEAHDLERLSMVMRRLGRHQEAFVLGLEALDLWHRLGARSGMAGTLGTLARTYLPLGLYEEAERAARQALDLREEIGDRYGRGAGLDTFALVLRYSGRFEEALKVELEALATLRESGDRHGEGAALEHLARIHLELGRAGEALETGEQSLDLAVELGDAREQAFSLHTMARACQALGAHARAGRHLRAEIEIRRDMGDHAGQRDALHRMRISALALDDEAGAADCTRRITAIDGWLEAEVPESDPS